MFTFDLNLVSILTFVVTIALPILVGLVTTRVTRPAVKAWFLAGLAAITGLGSEALSAVTSGQAYNLGEGLVTAITAFVIAVSLHYGIYKPTGASSAVQNVGTKDKYIDAPLNG